ncbi:ubiquitin carboxyl-terminal hydrolase 18 [Ricinus communis]|uniref:ubiquitinyl hydrolase 1 n=1 Tax=Ricinus communis TaxID=3988 RepID=B9RNQ1_RICCO|nr:ubiquitin carboxyl-terminal hydrolase 18 [Ricinus communis]EEF46819.1 cysteine-type endopeptidase, putative [Ricinus communis]|eukprot:XP_002515370.1 ubiquitin carboxyl-terminal hydrolase 18 [Ricinus communis]
MHVGGITVDLNWFLQFVFTLFLIALGLLHLVKNTASKYFEVDAHFEGGATITADRNQAPAVPSMESSCANCGNLGTKKCSRCKSVRYCSTECQEVHWKSGHKSKCKNLVRVNSVENAKTNFGVKASGLGGRISSGIALVPSNGITKLIKKPTEVLFPYDKFIKLYNWNKGAFPPCGLLNCGNSCFANVVLQCLTFTRPLVAYLLEEGHQRECRRNDWCFLCEFQVHVERASKSSHPFSPMSILSRLPNIGGNLGYGKQEDAHEFMRFAIDTMQSVCLDEYGGEKAVDPAFQETTLIQHIFGGHLQSQVICTKCNKISNQLENMMDLTVEIHGDSGSLEDCLEQFTDREQLHGENMYRCDGCNDYVKAWKRLTIRRAPNILTIALKRFQSGRFGKLNKRVAFPESLDLSPYTSEGGDGTDVYRLYAVVVHVDMLNASFFGHYICYIKDFCGNWYRVDDCKVRSVELEEVLSQGAYMLLYSRISARPSCLRTVEPAKELQPTENVGLGSCTNVKIECTNGRVECFSGVESINNTSATESLASERNSGIVDDCDVELSSAVPMDMDITRTSDLLEASDCDNDTSVTFDYDAAGEDTVRIITIDSDLDSGVPVECGKDSSSVNGCCERRIGECGSD